MTCTELVIKFLKAHGFDEEHPDDYVEIPYEGLIALFKAFEEKEG